MRNVSLTLTVCALALLPLAGCGTETGRSYTLRGEVTQPPSPSGELYLRHEAIDDWTSRSGQVEGMDSMTMPFAIDQGVSLEGLQAGDKVEATLNVDWEADLPVKITQLRELPPDTKLDFREAKPSRNP